MRPNQRRRIGVFRSGYRHAKQIRQWGQESISPNFCGQAGSDLVIVTGDAEYRVVGRDLSAMLGQNVKITGTLAEKDGSRSITVESVAPVE
jgi:hypothetical protein